MDQARRRAPALRNPRYVAWLQAQGDTIPDDLLGRHF
jgi:hypothetical protein